MQSSEVAVNRLVKNLTFSSVSLNHSFNEALVVEKPSNSLLEKDFLNWQMDVLKTYIIAVYNLDQGGF